jgi:hypothetical protein
LGDALVNSNTLSGALASLATDTSNVGNYAINQGDLAGGSNYTISFTSGRTMAVTPRLITVRADDLARDYGQPNPALTYRISSGSLVTGDGFGGSLFTSAGSGSGAGTYAISQGSLALSANYALTFVPGTLTIRAVQVQNGERASQVHRGRNIRLTRPRPAQLNFDEEQNNESPASWTRTLRGMNLERLVPDEPVW